MRIIEILSLSNGAHRNQTGDFKKIPEGWAVIPDDVETPNLPFGEVVAQKINGIMTVTEWVPGKTPRPFPDLREEATSGIGEVEQLRADVDYIAIMTGVEL